MPDSGLATCLLREAKGKTWPRFPLAPFPVYADTQIAAIAAVNGLILVTRNAADFAQFDSLMVENWFDRSAKPRP